MKFLSPFCNSTVGASIARPPLPNAGSCVLPRSPHRTPPPLPHPQTRKYTPAPLAGLRCRPLQAKDKAHAKTLLPFLLYSRGEHCSPGFAERWLLRFAPQPTPNTPRPHRSSQPPTPNSSLLTPNSPQKTKKSKKNLKNSQNFQKNTSKMAQLIAKS